MRWCWLILAISAVDGILQTGLQLKIDEFFESSGHTNNWAVLVCTSSNIIMMLAEDIPCNSRNPKPGTVFNAPGGVNLYGSDVEVDYRGNEVTVENFIRLLTGRHHESTSRSRRLLSDHQSNVLVYLTGHGGDSFLKFQDAQELTNVDLGYAIQTMFEDNRYHEMFVIVDTCRSESMYEYINSPRVLSTSSSLTHEESYSYDIDHEIGVFVIDRYTHFTLDFMNQNVKALNSSASLKDYLDSCPLAQCLSTVGVRRDTYPKDPAKVRVTDFFGSARILHYIQEDIVFDDAWLVEPVTYQL